MDKYRIDLINKHMPEIKRLVKCKIYNGRLGGRMDSSVIEDALSYIPDASLEWKPERSKNMDFAAFCAELCIFRTVDQYRRSERKMPVNIMDGSGEFVTENKFVPNKSINDIGTAAIEDSNFYFDSGLERVDWIDLKDRLLKEADRVFSEGNHRIYKILLTDHIIPKSEGSEYRTLSIIAQEVGLSEGRLSQMMKSDKMKELVTKLYRKNHVF